MRIICTVINDLSHDQRMHRICSTLQGAGFEVTLVGRLLPGSPALPYTTYRTHRIRCRARAGKRFYIEYNWRLYRYLRTRPSEVICAVDLDTLLPATLAAHPGRMVVYDAHEWFSETPEVVRRPLIRGLWRTLGRWLVPKASLRYTVGFTLAEQLEQDYGVPFSVIRNLPVYSVNTFKENSGGVLLYQGMLNPGRGIDVAIRALAYVPNCTLWIIGSGPEEDALRQLTLELDLPERVWFAGFRPPAELPALTGQAWLGLNLLEHSSPSYYYSLANKSLDYIQAGLPSIQMDFPEYRLIQDRYDVFQLLATLSPPALAAQIQQLLDRPDRYATLRANCRRAATELCWEREAPKLIALYESLRHSG